MRALCGAIITAGALIGLGLTAVGIGQRYTMEKGLTAGAEPAFVRLSQMDSSLIFILVFLTSVAVVGLGISFLGLAYHHHRREREHHLRQKLSGQHQRVVT
jgi:F0F1-type ATP synthase membrane subunit c/vacuolar-type H+-ATPase subunit K